ncbi:maternal protein exuperantia isoform X2 [Episyrphus balteatus]|uniref:maternal protein exuperantia isoform X2 n=1 Tax=Episyrphus balteatus TaxID=286459 RepID=UPI0024861311|nr:maternal protein exuperantia isoform X2 [Episyrphus balteatus]
MGSLNEPKTVKTLPKGKYTLVGVDIDTTGKRLIDEIVQLAAYTPNSHFEQYIMPYMNLNPAATNRHQVRVITIGFYRMLKSLQTFKVIKSKSEVAALKDFLNWLESLKKSNPESDGIVMIYHEERKFIPYMILESLKKYDLLERFQQTVKAFANGFHLAQKNVTSTNEDGTIQYLSLRKLAKTLSGVGDKNNNNEEQVVSSSTSTPPKVENGGDASVSPKTENNKKQRRNRRRSNSESDLFDGSASIRAKMTYNVALRLTNNNNNNNDDAELMHEIITQYAQPISCDLDELESQNLMLERQNSFRPVFLNYFKATLQHRLRAVKYRIILAENGHDLTSLNTIWTEKQKEGLAEVIQAIEDLKQEDKTDLIELFDSFYDPAKTTIKPVIKSTRRAPRRSGGRNKENQAGGDANNVAGDNKMQPDSTTKDGTPARRTPRSRRGPRSRNNSNAKANGANTTISATAVVTPVATPIATPVAAVVPEIAKKM